MRRENEETEISVINLIMNYIVHILLLITSLFIVYKSFENGVVLFAWHPSLMSIGVNIICFFFFYNFYLFKLT